MCFLSSCSALSVNGRSETKARGRKMCQSQHMLPKRDIKRQSSGDSPVRAFVATENSSLTCGVRWRRGSATHRLVLKHTAENDSTGKCQCKTPTRWRRQLQQTGQVTMLAVIRHHSACLNGLVCLA